MAAPLVALALAGTAVQAYGTMKASEAEAESLLQQAGIERLVAQETLYRAEVDQNLSLLDLQKGLADITSGFAESQVDVTTGSPLLAMRDLVKVTNREIAIANREAVWEAQMSERKAQSLERASRDTRKAGKLKALGQVIGGAGSAFGK